MDFFTGVVTVLLFIPVSHRDACTPICLFHFSSLTFKSNYVKPSISSKNLHCSCYIVEMLMRYKRRTFLIFFDGAVCFFITVFNATIVSDYRCFKRPYFAPFKIHTFMCVCSYFVLTHVSTSKKHLFLKLSLSQTNCCSTLCLKCSILAQTSLRPNFHQKKPCLL